MDNENKYQEALERAKKFKNGEIEYELEVGENIVEYIFPELKENEDERIMNSLIIILQHFCKGYRIPGINPPVNYKDILAWLEKQGEQNSPQTNERAWLYLVSDVLTWKDGIGQYLDDPRVQELAKRLCGEYAQKLYNPSALSNQESSDKVKPKFKVGDWVVGGNAVYQITALNNELQCYIAVSINNETVKIPYYFDCGQNHMCSYHLWTIEDAKDGDILAVKDGKPFIFKDFSDENHSNAPTAYCGIDILDNFISGLGRSWWTDKEVYPATQEQRYFLFKK